MNSEDQFPQGAGATPTNPTTPPAPEVEQTDPISFSPDPVAVPEKKRNRTPIILGIVLGVLLLAGSIFGILMYVRHTKPETVALDAMSKLLNEKAVKAEGSIDISFDEDNTLGLTSIKVRLNDASSSILPSAVTGAVIFGTENDEISLDVSSAIMSDGKMYFQFSGVTEVLHGAIPEELNEMLEFFEKEIEEFDGQWYELDLVDIATSLGATSVDTSDYDCAIAGLNSLNTDNARSAFVSSYKENPFMIFEETKLEKDGATGYSANADADSLTAFFEHLENKTSALDGFADCPLEPVESFESSYLPNVTLYITHWEHELKAIDISFEDSGTTLAGSLNLTFPESTGINTPDNTKPFSKFANDFIKKLSGLVDEEDPGDGAETSDIAG